MQKIVKWLSDLSTSQRVVVGSLALLVLYLLGTSFSTENQANKLDLSYVGSIASESEQVRAEIYVHVAGEVEKPGLYSLSVGSRVEDAIELAGGMTRSAFEQSVNLARMVSDGEQIVVLDKSQVSAAGAASEFISLNNATMEQLESLPGVGPSLASRIIDHRTAIGSFSDLSQLRDVSGIGEKLYAKISTRLTL
ncbi:MAG: helix-hairpin-helix domain-containing protein [Actinomycetota bacterium]|nr:helix-hairpin-helix domain-containing protein [Actinomycetota bacterium]